MSASLDARRGALLVLLLPILIWSYNWIVMKQVLTWIGPFDFSALRFGLAVLLLFALMLARGESLRPPPLGQTVLIGLAQTAGFQALVQWALVDGGAGRTALLAYTMPFWVVPLAWWLLADRPGPRQWLSLAVAAIGLLFVLEPWRSIEGAGNAALAIGGGLCWAIGTVLSKRLFRRGGISALSLTTWQMAFGALALLALLPFTQHKPIVWSNYLLGALAYNAVLASGVAWLLWSWVVDKLPASVVGLSSLSVPIAGIAFAWILLGERPSPMEAVGIALIAAALVIVNLRRPRAS
ncbi:EamA family transporter [Dokdonella sp.]|uniref:DMT family transporter n=1 Tax=Dokdonella sp. TaxID=2291710 RepID=UPI001B0C8702|nr:EamA family transporter [Dokdonella sp.]MBO9661558.1 EamA family transporter [Dokdonella sp.]